MRISVRVSSVDPKNCDDIIKLLTQLNKTDFLYDVKIECVVSVP